ncbi:MULTISPECIES: acyl-CoA carboxylase subunit epsilon [unclassified Streptomyces]|uniref:acyl-CoA carboxylase subunit epsilon n=1 Tax=unclassified Streptomyces TaxID=2593676 RepID=UPI0037F2C112
MRHHLHIHRGRPNALEIAALTVVLSALGNAISAGGGEPARRTSRAHWDRSWTDHVPATSWQKRH